MAQARTCTTCYNNNNSESIGGGICCFCQTYSCDSCMISHPEIIYWDCCLDCVKTLNATTEFEKYTACEKKCVEIQEQLDNLSKEKEILFGHVFDRIQNEHAKIMNAKVHDVIKALVNRDLDAVAFSTETSCGQRYAFSTLYNLGRIIIPAGVVVEFDTGFELISVKHDKNLNNEFELKRNGCKFPVDKIDTKTMLEPEIGDPWFQINHPRTRSYRIGLIMRANDAWLQTTAIKTSMDNAKTQNVKEKKHETRAVVYC